MERYATFMSRKALLFKKTRVVCFQGFFTEFNHMIIIFIEKTFLKKRRKKGLPSMYH